MRRAAVDSVVPEDSGVSPSGRRFAWRDEWPFVVAAAALAALIRAPIILHAVEITHGDTGIVALMMRRIWRGEDLPLFYYGQAYMGALDPLMCAPFVGLLGPRFEALAAGQTAVFCLLAIPLVYRLLHLIGGRSGAAYGTAFIAVGSPWLAICTAGRYTGYLSTFWLGTLILLLGLDALRQGRSNRDGAPASVSPHRLALIGFLMGLGWYNNPQIALFVMPLALAVWLRDGQIPQLRAEGGLSRALGRGPRWALGATVAVLAAAFAFFVGVCFVQGAPHVDAVAREFDWAFGPLSLSLGERQRCFLAWRGTPFVTFGSPENYLPRIVVATLAVGFILEWSLARSRRRLTARLAVFGLAVLVGATPAFVAKWRGTEGRSAPLDMNPAWIPWRYEELRFANHVWLADGEEEPDSRPPSWFWRAEPGGEPWQAQLFATSRTVRTAAEIAWWCLLGAWLVHRGRDYWRAIRCLPVVLVPLDLLLLQQIAFVTLFLMHPLWASGRYFIFGWLLLGGLVAWAVASTALTRWRWLGRALLMTLLAHYALQYSAFLGLRLLDGRRLPEGATIAAELQRRGLTHGIADYAEAYHLMFQSDERLVVVCKDRVDERLAASRARMHAHRGRVFRLSADWVGHDVVSPDGFGMPEFLDPRGHEVRVRWRHGNYVVYEYEKTGIAFE